MVGSEWWVYGGYGWQWVVVGMVVVGGGGYCSDGHGLQWVAAGMVMVVAMVMDRWQWVVVGMVVVVGGGEYMVAVGMDCNGWWCVW